MHARPSSTSEQEFAFWGDEHPDHFSSGGREPEFQGNANSESCYELSLKDIVAEEHSLQEGEEDSSTVAKDETFDEFKAKAPLIKLNRKKDIKKGQITRTVSLESETFLIKSFLPSSLGLKKKAKSARDPSIKSSEETESDIYKVGSIKRIFVAGRRNKICRNSTNGSTSSSHSSSSSSSSTSTSITRYLVYNFGLLVLVLYKEKQKHERKRMHLLNEEALHQSFHQILTASSQTKPNRKQISLLP